MTIKAVWCSFPPWSLDPNIQSKLRSVQRMDWQAQWTLKGLHRKTHVPFISFRCDPGFSGPACEMASQTFPMFISESFGSSRLSSYHNFYSIRGAEVSFGCGVLASGKALVFNKDGRRQLITSFLDSSQSRWVWWARTRRERVGEGGWFSAVLFSLLLDGMSSSL